MLSYKEWFLSDFNIWPEYVYGSEKSMFQFKLYRSRVKKALELQNVKK